MKVLKRLLIFLFLISGILWIYTSSLIGVAPKAKNYLNELDIVLSQKGLSSSYFVISGRRWKWDNYLLSEFGGAAKNSKHKLGQAIDIIILDINQDGNIDSKDVDIVFKILDREIVKNKGGIGTYKNESGFFNQQMIHFDCRGTKARWQR